MYIIKLKYIVGLFLILLIIKRGREHKEESTHTSANHHDMRKRKTVTRSVI